jgi:predicted SAM-dependent methyltransferase
MALFNVSSMEQVLNHISSLPSSKPGVYLNLGCGKKTISGFVNVDKYFTRQEGIVNEDISDIPYYDNSVDLIYSSHALEHLSIRKSKVALREWYRVLKPGGQLYLAIPDLELICRVIQDQFTTEEQMRWFLFTLFGYQVDQEIDYSDKSLDHVDHPGEFHCSGYTKKSLMSELKSIGFEINKIFSYDGYSTPSIWCEAVK